MLAGARLTSPARPAAQQPPAGANPIAVRNQTAQPGREVLVLRHQQLRKGAHDDYYRASREGVWPWYEKIAIRTRPVGRMRAAISTRSSR
jgi:hypothetical protein